MKTSSTASDIISFGSTSMKKASGRKQKAKQTLLVKENFQRTKWMGKYFREFSNYDQGYYYRCLRMSLEIFQHLYNFVCPLIAKQDTKLNWKCKKLLMQLENIPFRMFFECITIISFYFIDFKLSPESGDRKLSLFHFGFIIQ